MLDRTARIRGRSGDCATSASKVDHPNLLILHRVLRFTEALRLRLTVSGHHYSRNLGPHLPWGVASRKDIACRAAKLIRDVYLWASRPVSVTAPTGG